MGSLAFPSLLGLLVLLAMRALLVARRPLAMLWLLWLVLPAVVLLVLQIQRLASTTSIASGSLPTSQRLVSRRKMPKELGNSRCRA